MKTKMMARVRVLGLAMAGLAAMSPGMVPAQGEDEMAKAETSLKQAQKEEAAAYDEHYSRDMARAATSAIAVAERARAEAALKGVRDAREALK